MRAVLAKLPPDSGIAFVVIQHLDPARKSALATLLSQATSLPVVEISNGEKVQPNQVYVVPHDKRASVRDGVLLLGPITSRNRQRPIDDFMTSLATALGDAAIGVVLSGMGSDGTYGLGAVKAAGGVTFAQDPKTAQWAAMPLSGIESGDVDFVLSPGRIGLQLGRLARRFYRAPERERSIWDVDKILEILRAETGIDFNRYKQSFVIRRILRQMALQEIGTVAEYLKLLRRDRKERESLADHIFVPFTSFFREAESLKALQRYLRPDLLRKPPKEPVRVWVTGCSTGEEVYSIAMLMVERLGPMANTKAIQIFGTDIREHAVEYARAGVYSGAAVAGVTAARLKRFFTKSDGGYRVNEELRRLCLFARHDLTRDPPFSNLDLISCRNVLLYLRSEFQDQALAVFHYALKPRAFLLTDNSLTDKASSHFTLKDPGHGIFSRKPDAIKSWAERAAL